MDDLEFVQRCIRRDRGAWDEFIKKYSRLIYNYINNILSSQPAGQFSRQNSDDLFQEIFLSLTQNNFKKLKTFQGRNGCSLASWLRQVTLHQAIDFIRQKNPLVSLEEERHNGLNPKDVLRDNRVLASEKIAAEEKIGQLKECIQTLDVSEKFFLKLHLHKGLTLQELTVFYRVSRGAMDMRRARLLEKLKECFRKKGFLLD